MKLTNYLLLSAILAIFLFSSCNREEIETNKGTEFSKIILPDSVNIQVDNNILGF